MIRYHDTENAECADPECNVCKGSAHVVRHYVNPPAFVIPYLIFSKFAECAMKGFHEETCHVMYGGTECNCAAQWFRDKIINTCWKCSRTYEGSFRECIDCLLEIERKDILDDARENAYSRVDWSAMLPAKKEKWVTPKEIENAMRQKDDCIDDRYLYRFPKKPVMNKIERKK